MKLISPVFLTSVFLILMCNCSQFDLQFQLLSHTGHVKVKHPPLIVISFDGFRWDYIYRPCANLTSFQRFKKEGVYAKKGMKNVFPTNTIPNHWTLATGLYPESHGMINNDIHDDNINTKFIPKWINKDYKNDPRYYDAGGEPIWVTNEMQSKSGRSGIIMWYGAENPVKYFRPSLHMDYDDDISFETRIDTAIDWLTLDHDPINLAMIYLSEPDNAGHEFGAESENVTAMISKTNDIVDYLLRQLEERDMLDGVNIIITSDHGQVDVSQQKLIILDDIVPSYMYSLLEVPPVASTSIYPHEGYFDEVFEKLQNASLQADSHFKVFTNETIPERYHYKHNARVPPIVTIADLHYSFLVHVPDNYNPDTDPDTIDLNNKGIPMPGRDFILRGLHGYDNDAPEMHPLFMAMGPSFRAGETVQKFNNVDVYPLMCSLLGLTPAPNNGSLNVVSHLLTEP